ncbi:hypothetical protein RZS08_23920, partial [Arthrospira platensis SPKY1]|nr:hypothetical protein [Arthrospira platensis SPKY1]
RADAQLKSRFGGEALFVELALNIGGKHLALALQRGQPRLVDTEGVGIVRCQDNMRLRRIRRRALRDEALQHAFIGGRHPARPQRAKQGEEARVFLAKHVFERQQRKLGFPKDRGIEEIAAAVTPVQDRALLG